MAFTLPALPYARDALAPHISENTLNFHYAKHHQAYVDNLNKLIAGTPLESAPLEEVVKQSWAEKKMPVFNNSGQVWNHTFYWHSMKPQGGGKPTGLIADKINKDFGSFDEFKAKFAAFGYEPFPVTRVQFEQFIRSESARQGAELGWVQRLLYRHVLIPLLPRIAGALERNKFDFLVPDTLSRGREFGPGRVDTWALYKRVFVHPAEKNKVYELTVLGDLHGCYSCLKGALLQASRQLLESLIREQRLDCEFQASGLSYVYRTEQAFAHDREEIAGLNEFGIESRLLDEQRCTLIRQHLRVVDLMVLRGVGPGDHDGRGTHGGQLSNGAGAATGDHQVGRGVELRHAVLVPDHAVQDAG